MGKMLRIVGERLKEDTEFQDAVDAMFSHPGSMVEKFKQLFNKVFEHGEITWQRITVLFYVAGRMAVKVMEESMPTLVFEIFKLTVEYFKTKLLVWVHSHGGWLCARPWPPMKPTQYQAPYSSSSPALGFWEHHHWKLDGA
ncbi:hypothetical protein CRUP_008367 [Coryphaenoides rupestris]|nr:hypothetical protein CRUP_008367 [Coryphaenoides rupestris]